MPRLLLLSFLALLGLCPPALANASNIEPTPKVPEPTESPYDHNLLGSIGGLRHRLAAQGVEMLLAYKGDFFLVPSGGIKRGRAYIDNTDLRFDIDNAKLLGWKDNHAAIHFTHNAGSKPNARLVGSAMGVDGIEPTTNALLVYELWDEQGFFDNRLWLRAGISDVNNEFMYTESGLNFLQPTMQMGQTYAQAGVNGPPSFPYSTLSARLKYQPDEVVYAQAAVYNGSAGDPDHPYGNTHFQFDEGVMLIAEAGITPRAEGVEGKPNIFALGGWVYSKRADDLLLTDANGTPLKKHSWGLYALSSHLFYHDAQGRSLNAFFHPSLADGDTAQMRYAYQLGMQARGWVRGREHNEIGLGLAQAITGGKYRASVASDRSEYALELYMRDRLRPGLTLQPDIQYIINPSANPGIRNATVLALRVDLNF